MDTILSTRWKVYYEAENRQKRLVRDTGVTPTVRDTVKDFYLALADLFHSATQMDDGTPMSAQTPTEYTIGIIDSGDDDPWFIDPESTEYLTGGAIKTALWLRDLPGDGTGNTGIVRFDYTVGAGTDLATSDIGKTALSDDGDSGTLLDFVTDGSNGTAWIRPDTNALADDWNSTAADFDITGGVGLNLSQDLPATSGEMLWANVYNTGIASLSVGTHQYAYQGFQTGDSAPDARIATYKTAGEDWWGDGTFDVLLLVADQAADLTDPDEFIDKGFVSFFARQYSETYSFYIVNLFAGGRNPIPMETGNDLNNPTGYWTATTGVHGVSTFVVGEEIQKTGDATKRGIITAFVDDTSITWYQIGEPQSNFVNAEEVTGQDSGTTATLSQAPQAAGPSVLAGLSAVYGSDNTFDIDNDATNEYYSIVLDVSDERLDDAYEWAKYTLRNGSQGTGDTNDIEAEQFIGIDYLLGYTALNGSLAEGDHVEGATSGAEGTIVAIHTTPKIVTIRNARGTFTATETVQEVGTPGNNITAVVPTSISPIKSCPWGIFAGGTWFLAQGVVLNNVNALDANNYQVTDDEGNINTEPTQVAVFIGNTRIKDWISLLRLDIAGGVVEKDYYDLDTITAVGDNTLSVDPAIRTGAGGDDVGEPGAGSLVVITSGIEYVYRYTSFTGDDFTLFNVAQRTSDAGGTSTELDDVSEDFVADGIKVGDIIRNDTLTEYVYITKVETTKLTTTPLSGGTWDSDLYTVGSIVAVHAVNDFMYVLLMHIYETAGTDGSPGNETVGLIYEGDENALLRVRHANDTVFNIKPFSLEVTIGSGGLTQNAIRQEETITS